PTVLFVGPQHDAHGAARPQVQLLHDAERFPRHHASAAIVGRTGPDVPRVEVTADDDDFLGTFAPADLGDDIGGLDVRLDVPLHPQPHDYAIAAGGHAIEGVGVFAADRGGRNARRAGLVLDRAGVREAQSV